MRTRRSELPRFGSTEFHRSGILSTAKRGSACTVLRSLACDCQVKHKDTRRNESKAQIAVSDDGPANVLCLKKNVYMGE